MVADDWKIWDRDDSVEMRSYKRTTGELPEMESTKQLVQLISDVYQHGMSVLDVGCAAGHYYLGLRRIDDGIRYHGVDATKKYIDFAKSHFSGTPNVSFSNEDIFALPQGYTDHFDIVYCCNVLLHLPSARHPRRPDCQLAIPRCGPGSLQRPHQRGQGLRLLLSGFSL